MWLIFLFALICCLFFWIYSRWMCVRTYWAQRNVPYLPPNPIFGSLTNLYGKNLGIWFRELYSQFESPYIGIWWFWRPALVVNSPEIARRILVKDSDKFRDRLLSSGKSDPIGGLNIFTVNDPLWSSVRRRLTAVFTTAKLKVMHDLISTKSQELCQRIHDELKKKKNLDIYKIYTDYTTDVTGTASFGVNCNATLTGDDPLRRVTQDFQTYSTLRGVAFSFICFFPEMVDFFRFSFFPKYATDYFRKIFKMVVEQRGGYDREITEARDLLDFLVKMKQDAAKDDEDISEDVLVAQAAIFLQGGFETSAAILTYMTYELAYHPEIQEKLYKEILEIKLNIGNGNFDMHSLSTAVYLNCVIKEALRKYPIMGWLDRKAASDYKIDDNLTIAAGTPVYINVTAMHIDPDYFPDPEKFIPERFLPDNEQNIKAFTFLPFGDGPRNCIGMRFGYLSLRSSLANLVMTFKMLPKPDAPLPKDIKISFYSPFFLPGEVLSIEYVPRQ